LNYAADQCSNHQPVQGLSHRRVVTRPNRIDSQPGRRAERGAPQEGGIAGHAEIEAQETWPAGASHPQDGAGVSVPQHSAQSRIDRERHLVACFLSAALRHEAENDRAEGKENTVPSHAGNMSPASQVAVKRSLDGVLTDLAHPLVDQGGLQ